MFQVLVTQEHLKASDVFKRFRDSFLIKYFGICMFFFRLVAGYLLNKDRKSEREKAMPLKNFNKLNRTAKDAKAFVREFIKKYSVKESKVYGKNPNHSVRFDNVSIT